MAVTAFTMGLVGGVHCVAMCGGIIGALSVNRASAPPGIHLAYNAGRIASYVVAGMLAGSLGGLALEFRGLLPVQSALAVLANAFVVLLGLHFAGWGRLVAWLEVRGASLWRTIQPLARCFVPADTTTRAVALGLIWGWLPCGLVYAALALALLAGTAARGGTVMLAFGIGTLPYLLLAGLAAQRMGRTIRNRRVRMAAGTFIVLVGLLGFARIPGLADSIRYGILCMT